MVMSEWSRDGLRMVVSRREVSGWFDALYRGDMRYKDRPTILDCARDLEAHPSAVARHWPTAPDLAERAKMREETGEGIADLAREYAERYPHHTQAMCAYVLGVSASWVSASTTGVFSSRKSGHLLDRVIEAQPDATTKDFLLAGLSRTTTWREKKRRE